MSSQESFNYLKLQVENYEQSESTASRAYAKLIASIIFIVQGLVGIMLMMVGPILIHSALSVGIAVTLFSLLSCVSLLFCFHDLQPIEPLLFSTVRYFFGKKINSRIAVQKRNIVSILRRDIYILSSMKHAGGEWESIATKANKILTENEIKYVVTELTIE